MKRSHITTIFTLCVLGYSCSLKAQEVIPKQPVLPIRFLENYEAVKDSTDYLKGLNKLKYIPLNESKSSYLSIGAEVKMFYETVLNREDEGDGYLLTRIMAHADLHLGSKFRLFVQPASGFDTFREARPRPIDRDEFFFLNLFADYTFIDTEKATITARLGRQELNYGRGRLITIREGPNIRQYWEGVLLKYENEKWKGDSFFTKYGTNLPGVLDNPIFDTEETFWGTYWQSKKEILLNANVDLYYLGFIDEISQFFNATGEETRHSVGARAYRSNEVWDIDLEATAQFGEVGNSSIGAFGFFGDLGYTLNPKDKVQKRLGLKAEYFTGDSDATDDRLNTFNPMYPRQGYYRGAGALYAANFWDIRPSFTIEKANDFSFIVNWAWYWRTSVEDGIYTGGIGIPLIEPTSGNDKYLGSQLNFKFNYILNKNLNLTMDYAHFFSGGFIEDNPSPMEISDFMNVTLIYRF